MRNLCHARRSPENRPVGNWSSAMRRCAGFPVITSYSIHYTKLYDTPDDMARMQLGIKRVTPEAIAQWKAERGYDKPLFINGAAPGLATLTDIV